MEKFDCNFDALEIEAHAIVCNEDEAHRYEPWDFDADGAVPDVWSVFGNIPAPTAPGSSALPAGRKLIADCETADAAVFIAELVRAHIRNGYYRNEFDVKAGKVEIPEVPVYWFTKRD
jgi:hypothetical protein